MKKMEGAVRNAFQGAHFGTLKYTWSGGKRTWWSTAPSHGSAAHLTGVPCRLTVRVVNNSVLVGVSADDLVVFVGHTVTCKREREREPRTRRKAGAPRERESPTKLEYHRNSDLEHPEGTAKSALTLRATAESEKESERDKRQSNRT